MGAVDLPIVGLRLVYIPRTHKRRETIIYFVVQNDVGAYQTTGSPCFEPGHIASIIPRVPSLILSMSPRMIVNIEDQTDNAWGFER